MRHSPRRTEAARDWASFVAANAAVAAEAGLPALATESIAHWDDLLRHGRCELHQDPAAFALSQLSPQQYQAYVSLVDSYFAAGYEYYTPTGLGSQEQDVMRARYGTGL